MAKALNPAKTAAMGSLIVLLFLVVLLNYVDRGAIAIAAPLMKPEFGLSATEFGVIVSAFFWVYAPLQYGIGWLCDRFCVYRLLAAGVALWGVATFSMSLAYGVGTLIVLRLLLGIGESFTFPAATKVIARHVPPESRGIANAGVAMGLAFGPAVGTLVGGLIVAAHGWRPQFAIFGLVTLLWVIPWLYVARNLPSYQAAGREEPVPVAAIARNRAVWAMGLVQFAGTYTFYFAVTWFPLFLVQSQGFSIKQMTFIATLAFVAQGVGAFLVGWLSDRWTRSGGDEAKMRRRTMVVSMILLAAAIIGLAGAKGEGQLIFWMMMVGATSAAGGVNLYAVAQMFAGPRAAGTFVGIQNATGNMSGIVGPIITGMIIDFTGSYLGAFWVTAGIALAGALGWAFIVPHIRQLDFDSVQRPA